MKYLVGILVGLLPFHALLVTTLKCRFNLNTDILRFWKEGIVILLFIITVVATLNREKWNVSKIYKNNYILGTATTFVLCSVLYIVFPFLQIQFLEQFPFVWLKLSALLGFKYDVFFIFCLIIGLYLGVIKQYYNKILLILFSATGCALMVFTPWYIFGDISTVTSIFGFSSEVSTYIANECISFSQNVEGQHRFQGSFAGPIRWSVFLTIVYFLYLGYFINFLKNTSNCMFVNSSRLADNGFIKILDAMTHKSKALLVIPSLLVITSIFYSYSKTSVLGLLFGGAVFAYLVFTVVYEKRVTKKMAVVFASFMTFPILLIAFIKRDLFLHLGSVINRFDNLIISLEMFMYNPIGYGLGIAGPASSVGNSIESAGSWETATASIGMTHKFLPENWYMQILLEQGIWGLGFFVWFLFTVGGALYMIMKKKKDFFSVGIFVSFVSLLFMANFTHAFEESATSYILFLLIGGYIAKNVGRYYQK